ncbi:hypothetical protein [Haloferax prahovense]|uniref:hypothetical protein n=1 Tax=Haloferax prahovense TaxID=381852 RepID=UPI0012DF7281|nr:hypothetical protein [Haloferax prahovense]
MAKYVPLLSAAAPAMIYISLNRKTSIQIAFLGAITFASTRSLISFYTKFVEESLAVLLFTILFVSLYSAKRGLNGRIVTLILLMAIALTHHAASVFIFVFVLIDALPEAIRRLSHLDRLQPKGELREISSLSQAVYGLSIVAFFIYVANQFSSKFSAVVISSLSSGQTTATGADLSGVPNSVLAVISRGAIVVIFLFILLCIISVLSRRRASGWEYTWIGYGAVISIVYAATLLAGRVLPLDPIRLLIYLVPMVSVPALAYVLDQGETITTARKVIAIVLVISFMSTQIAALGAHQLVSDRSNVVLAESHYSESQHQASRWLSNYNSDPVFVYEKDIWAAYQNEHQDIFDIQQCPSQLAVDRSPEIIKPDNSIYNNGPIGLGFCW